MPRVKRFSASEIAMYFDDHNPPHFHVLGRDGDAQIAIDTLDVLNSSGRVDLREALAWAAENQSLLQATWASFRKDDA